MKPTHIKRNRYTKYLVAVRFPDGEIRVIEAQNAEFAKALAEILKKLKCEILVGWGE